MYVFCTSMIVTKNYYFYMQRSPAALSNGT